MYVFDPSCNYQATSLTLRNCKTYTGTPVLSCLSACLDTQALRPSGTQPRIVYLRILERIAVMLSKRHIGPFKDSKFALVLDNESENQFDQL